MLVILNTAKSAIAVQTDRIRAITPNRDDTACIVSFSETHEIEVVGSLAKVRGKLAPAAPAAAPPAVDTPAPADDDPDEASPPRIPIRRSRSRG